MFEQGDRGELVYVIEAGTVVIERRHSDGTDEELARLGIGEYFGELGPLLGFPVLGHGPCPDGGRAARLQRGRLPAAAWLAPPRGSAAGEPYSKSMAEKSRSLEIWWRALIWRTVPDFERITSDWVVAPRLS